jgi:regulatory protein
MSNRSNPRVETEIDQYQQAYATALRLLARREHSVQELFHKLKGRQYAAPIAEQVIEVLLEEGAISDRRFTEIYVLGRFELGFGPLRIRAELRERGIGDTLADAALAEYCSEWGAQARRIRRKRFGLLQQSDFNERVRQMRFLEQRGFGGDQIREAMRDVNEALA